MKGEQVTFTNVDRSYSGTYVCTANNGYAGQEVREKIHLDVEYSPEVQVEEIFVPTKLGTRVRRPHWHV